MSKKIISIAHLFLIVFVSTSLAKDIIPQPLQLIKKKGIFSIDQKITIYGNHELPETDYLVNVLRTEFGLSPVITRQPNTKGIQLHINTQEKEALGEEGYQLRIDAGGVRIDAATNGGIFYGIQSLRQLLEAKSDGIKVGYVEIKDKPRFVWRSYMLDEGRYFKGKEVVKKMLDEMALLKMNIFHWHLTEDQGWRLAIEKYPQLTAIGAKRDSTQIGDWNSKVYDGKVHEGYYSQAEVKDIIAYAAERHIQVVPEIEMPGHSSAAIAAYPWLGVTKKKISVPTNFGVKYDVFDVADPKVIDFLQDVLKEVIALFPSDVIHIGGDEVKYDQWMQSEKVQAYMKAHQLSSPADLQIAFTNDISNYVASKGRKMMGWNDIMGAKLHEYNNDAPPVTGSLAKSTIVQFWKGDLDMVKEAVSKGYHVVNSYHEFTYLDYSYKSIPLEKAYNFDPIPEGLETQYHQQILGLGCQMWGEWIPTEASMYKMTFPRIAAYAEVGWTIKENRDVNRFKQTLESFYGRWRDKGIDFHED